MKIFIITECNEKTGFGHLSRCLSLYETFKENNFLPILIVNGDYTVDNILSNEKFLIYNWLNNLNRLFDEINDSDLVIIDSYLAEYHIYEKISKIVKLTVYIDDNARLNYPNGVVINGSIHAKYLDYPERKNLVYLLGSEYCMLNKIFWNLDNKTINKNVENILITFGGNDIRNLVPIILKKIREHKINKKIYVIIGKGFKNISEIEKAKNEYINLFYFPKIEEMKEIMYKVDIAITAAGITTYELAAVGVPAITIAIADNQIKSALYCNKLRINTYAGWWHDKNLINNIFSNIKKLNDFRIRSFMNQQGKKFIKSDGSRFIVYELLKIIKNKKL